jgi:hypothetical protein
MNSEIHSSSFNTIKMQLNCKISTNPCLILRSIHIRGDRRIKHGFVDILKFNCILILSKDDECISLFIFVDLGIWLKAFQYPLFVKRWTTNVAMIYFGWLNELTVTDPWVWWSIVFSIMGVIEPYGDEGNWRRQNNFYFIF